MHKPSIAIISYFDKNPRTLAHYNHEAYARKNGYTYIFDKAPTTRSGFFAKIEKILKFLDHFDYVFWIDDDAFFMQKNKKLESFIDEAPDADLIFCKSPVNPSGGWTYFSSGNFFIKNTDAVKKYFKDVMKVNLKVAEKHWDYEKHGMFTHGDQDAMIHVIKSRPKVYREGSFFIRLPFEKFNSRPYHFERSASDQFIVHFAGVDDKLAAIDDFATKFKLNKTLTKGASVDESVNTLT